MRRGCYLRWGDAIIGRARIICAFWNPQKPTLSLSERWQSLCVALLF